MSKDNFANNLNELTLRESSLVRVTDGFAYRDLNKNGRLDVYEDPRQPLEARIDDLLGQMTLEEKAGLMFMDGAMVNNDGSLEEKADAVGFGSIAAVEMRRGNINHFNIWAISNARVLAVWHNNLQTVAEESRLGLPVTIASDHDGARWSL
jgi:beta-glucosidase